MRYLPISFLFLLVSSCALQTTKDLVATEISEEVVVNQYFSNPEKDYVYKAKIEVYGNKFGGILIIKKLSDRKHRVVFTTEFGNKLFDFLYDGDSFTKNYVVDDLDKKMIVNTLQKDFKLLISENNKVQKQYNSEEFKVYKVEDTKRNNFYFFNKNSNGLEKIVSTSKFKEKVAILFTEKEGESANNIAINHKNIKLTISLEKFK